MAEQLRRAATIISFGETPGGFPDYEDGADPGDPAPNPAPEAAPTSKKRAAKAPAKPEPAPAAPPPAPDPATAVARDLPSLDALKALVTQAVRKAQKKEGPTKILDLLPDFKTKTGLGFVMEAEDKHKEALADLIEAAGLTETAV